MSSDTEFELLSLMQCTNPAIREADAPVHIRWRGMNALVRTRWRREEWEPGKRAVAYGQVP
jgi:hypothetical protein